MPNIEAIPDEMCLYNALDPYHVNFDNKPLQNIIARQKMINSAVDLNTDILSSAKGSTGSLTDRLDASLQDSGHLIPSAIDLALHSIEEHTDSADYVRMTDLERDKLGLIADGATNISLSFETAGASSTPVDINDGTIILADSVSTSWRWTAGKIYLDMNFPMESAHTHFHDIEPANPSGDFMTYYLPYVWDDGTSSSSGSSLRVYVNGVRVSQDLGYVPVASSTSITSWASNKIDSEDADNKKFVLLNPLTLYDLIIVDFNRPYL